MPRHSIHPLLSAIIYVLAVLAVVQWMIILPLAIDAGLLQNLSCWTGGQCAAIETTDATRVIAFKDDFFFIAWNILPILMGVAHWALSSYYAEQRASIQSRFRNAQGEPPAETKANIRDSLLLVFALLGILGAIAIYAQLNKQALFIAEHAFLYWWDIRISPAIYYVRLVFVVTNIVLVALVLWESYWGLWTLYRITRTHRTVPLVLDPSRRFGMEEYGILTMMMITPWGLALATAIISWLDHHGKQGVSNVVGTLVMGVIALIGLYLIIEPLLRVSAGLRRMKERLLGSLSREVADLETYLGGLAQGDAAPAGDATSRVAPTYLVYRHVSYSSSWPLPRWFGPPTLFSLLSPFLGAFGISASTLIGLALQMLGVEI